MITKYWESEEPTTVDTGKNVLKFFPEAQRLQVSMPDWQDKDGQPCRGKTVTLNLSALHESPAALDLLRQVIAMTE